jgi:hypothetical protein
VPLNLDTPDRAGCLASTALARSRRSFQMRLSDLEHQARLITDDGEHRPPGLSDDGLLSELFMQG